MARKSKESEVECLHKGFPTLAFIILVLSVLWLLGELQIVTFYIPWIPVILIIVAIGWIMDHYKKR